MQKSLKSQNQKYLILFSLAHIAIFISCILKGNVSLHDMNITWGILTKPKSIYIGAMPIIIYMLNGFITANVKAVLVFWKLNNPLPACRAFSKYAYQDPRIDLGALEEKYIQLPSLPIEQNQLWYSMLKKHDNNTVVRDSHKVFLLMRDITAIHVILSVMQVLYIFATDSVSSIYSVALLAIYVLLAFSAQNYGKRFVCNVLAIESSAITRGAIE